MKITVSIPDPLFTAAEQFAQEKGLSRSELYAQALQFYLETHRDQAITDALNRLYADESSVMDSAFVVMQLHAISKDEW